MNAPIAHPNWHSAGGGGTLSEVKRKGGDGRMEWELPH